MVVALFSLALSALFVVSTAPAQAAYTCTETNLGSKNAPEWERDCTITGLPASFGGTFTHGHIAWLYNGDVTNSESGQLTGTLNDTAADGNCVQLWEYYQETPTAPWAYRFPVGQSVCGNGTSKTVSCTFNMTDGCTAVLNDRTGQDTIRLCTGTSGHINDTCEVIWKQDMAVKHG